MLEGAKWIKGDCGEGAVVFRKSFRLEDFHRAEIAVCGLGFYVLTMNWKRVGDDLLSPPFTAYDKRVLYQVYDVTDYLQKGENVVEITCGHGWYAMLQADTWNFQHAPWISDPKAICRLQADGKTVVSTDSSWSFAKSRTVYDSLRCGETYDATRDHLQFSPVFVATPPGGSLEKQSSPSVKLANTIEGKERASAREDGKQVRVYDFGENVTGNVEITVRGARGDELRIYYSERFGEGVELDRKETGVYVWEAGGDRFAEDRYVVDGNKQETWHGDFAFHGFRYVRIDYPESTTLCRVTARNFHTELKQIGRYDCDNAKINALHDACMRSTLTNFMHIPTDCPHREKNGWTADAFLSSYQTVYNFDVKAAYLKWLDDIVDTQRESGQICCIAPTPGWGYNWGSGVTWDAALFIVPWNVYSFTGDLSVLSRYEQPMKKYLSYLDGISDDDIYTIGLGDWCPPDHTPVMQTSALLTCYAKKVYDIYASVCTRLGNEAEAARAKARSAEIRAAFQKRFFGSHEAAQTYFASLVWFDMTDDKQESAARLAEMVKRDDGRVIGGIFGAQMIPEVLRDYGYFSLAWEAIQKDGYPSWLYMLSDGSGTLWERWDGKDSRNHHMFSTVDAFIHASLTGLRADSWSDDRKTLRLKPYFPNDIHRFSAEYELSCGKIVIAWDDETFRVVLPNGLQGAVECNGTEYVLQSGENVLQRKK